MNLRRTIAKLALRFGNEAQVRRALRGLGMRVGARTRFYSLRLPSEPWLVRIGEDCLVSNDVTFVTHGANTIFQDKYESLTGFGKIELRDKTYVGVNVTILPNVTCGPSCLIGAGSVVTKDVPPNMVVAGNPAKVICSLDDYEKKCVAGHLDVPKDRKALRKALEKHFWGDVA